MKLINRFMMVLSATFLLCGCSDDDEATSGGDAISLSTNIIQMDKKGGDVAITVSSSGDWRLSGMCDWVFPSATSGRDGDEVTFTIDPNDLDELRTATFKFFTGAQVAPLQIEVAPAYLMSLLSEENVSVSNAENTVSIQLTTNVAEPTISFSDGGEEWISFNKRSEFGGKVTYSFKTLANETYKDRTTAITLSSPLVEESVVVNVTQAQTNAIIPSENVLMYDDLAAREVSFTVRYNVDYKVDILKGYDWITDEKVSVPVEGEDGLKTVTLSYQLSEAPDTRGGTIRISNATNSSMFSEISVVQKTPGVEVVEIPDANLMKVVSAKQWVLQLTASQCIVLDAGREATVFSNSSYYDDLEDLTGIENFPNLKTLTLGYCTNMEKLDISGLHQVEKVSGSSLNNCEEYNLGDHPITEFDGAGYYGYSERNSLKIISTKLETSNLSLYSWYASYDEVTSIDVSECPALTTLNVKRSDKLKTLYLKKGQEIPNLTKDAATEIVYK